MIEQVVIVKRIFMLAENHTAHADALSAGIAISLFQDAVEQLTWCVVKKIGLDVKDTEGFLSLLRKIETSTAKPIPHKAKIIELNKARVNFKHYGNLPAASEAEKFRAYAQDFLIIACDRYLDIDFDTVSTASLIKDSYLRNHIEKAQKSLLDDDIDGAVNAIAHARFFLFQKLEQHLPLCNDQFVSYAAQVFEQVPEIRGMAGDVFKYIKDQLDKVARFNALAVAGGDMSEHIYYERILPRVTQFNAGNTRVRDSGAMEFTRDLAERAIRYVVETTLRVEGRE